MNGTTDMPTVEWTLDHVRRQEKVAELLRERGISMAQVWQMGGGIHCVAVPLCDIDPDGTFARHLLLGDPAEFDAWDNVQGGIYDLSADEYDEGEPFSLAGVVRPQMLGEHEALAWTADRVAGFLKRMLPERFGRAESA